MTIFDPHGVGVEITGLEERLAEPGFWEDTKTAREVTSRLAQLKEEISGWNKLVKHQEEVELLNEMVRAEGDEELASELEEKLGKLGREVDALEVRSLFRDKFDIKDAIVAIHPGAGGTESQDWAAMLLRMYERWADARGFKLSVKEHSPGDEAGIKSVTFTVSGKYAYGLLKAEKGVHRLVRISPFDASSRRHTSFASVDVVPVVDEEFELIIEAKDLKVETYRASGPGGQHVNVTDSAVRITHLPTGAVAQCQNERSQLQNRETAMRILKGRLFEIEREKQREELDKLRGEKMEIAWGSQIRSYVLHPYLMVKDHRTSVERGDAQRVLNGDLDEFILAYHRWLRAQSRK